MNSRPYRLTPAVALLLTTLFSGCYGWSTPGGETAQLVANREPPEIHLHLADGRSLPLFWPRVEADSLVGTRVSDTGSPHRLTVALDDVDRIQVRRVSVLRGLLLAGTPFLTRAFIQAVQ